MLKVHKDGHTSKGERLVIATDTSTGKLGVWVRCINYSHGRDVATWRYLLNGVSMDECETVFAKRNRD